MIKKLYWYLFVYDLNQTSTQTGEDISIATKKELLNHLTWLILFAYALLTFNTTIPVIADALAHTFWEKEHLSHEHSHHGKNHLQAQIAKAEKESGQHKSHSKSAAEDYTHILYPLPGVPFPAVWVPMPSYTIFQYASCSRHPYSDDPPPRSIAINLNPFSFGF